MYTASQILAAVSTAILLAYSVMKVKRKTILICNVLINLLLSCHYLLLKSYTSAICTGITTAMAFAFCYKNRMQMRYRRWMFIGFLFLFLLCGVLTWEDGWSVVAVAGNVLLAVALWNDNETVIKGLFVLVGILWIVLNAHLKSTAAIIGQVFSVLSNLLYFYRIRKNKDGKADSVR